MDHLKTTAERQSRWYCHRIVPRHVPVRPAETWADLLLTPPQRQKGRDAHPVLVEKQSTERDDNTHQAYEFVYSLPYEWLKMSTLPQKPAMSSPHATSTESGPPDIRPLDPGVPSNILKSILEVHGFAVISGVLSSTECSEALDLAWDWLEAASEAERHIIQQTNNSDTNIHQRRRILDRNDPSTYSATAETNVVTPVSYFPRTVEGGLMPFYGAGHSSFAWKIRSNPAVQSVFSALYEDDEAQRNTHSCTRQSPSLLSSLDGFVLWTTRHRSNDTGWFHVDQNPKHKPQFETIQGLVNLVPVTKETGGNALVVQSHIDFAKGHFCSCSVNEHVVPVEAVPLNQSSVRAFYEQRLVEIGTDDWLEIDKNDDVLLDERRVITVLLGAGDMLLWDSRVAHCSYPPAPTIKNKLPSLNKGLVRAATLVSMAALGTTSVPPATLKARKSAVCESRTLSHWVNKVAPLGEEHAADAALEQSCVEYMKAQQRTTLNNKPKVLYSWEDLNDEQKHLVVGNLHD